MSQVYEPTTKELQEVWRSSGLWRLGHRFEDDCKEPMLLRAMVTAIRARHKKNSLPEQGRLLLE